MRIRSLLLAASFAAGSLGFLATPAHAADASGCLTVHVNVNGSDVVNQTQCLPGQ